jgi:hypothetical protein
MSTEKICDPVCDPAISLQILEKVAKVAKVAKGLYFYTLLCGCK